MNFSQPHQDPQPIFHLEHDGLGNMAPAGEEAILTHGTHGLAEQGGGVGETAVGRLDLDVKWDGSQGGSDGDDDDQVCPAAVEWIDGNHQHGPSASLLVPTHGIEIS